MEVGWSRRKMDVAKLVVHVASCRIVLVCEWLSGVLNFIGTRLLCFSRLGTLWYTTRQEYRED